METQRERERAREVRYLFAQEGLLQLLLFCEELFLRERHSRQRNSRAEHRRTKPARREHKQDFEIKRQRQTERGECTAEEMAT